MPRLSDIDYVRNHLALRKEWTARGANAFAYITPTDQFIIHDYYEPSLELDAVQLITHRRATTEKSPSLPQLAGKAFARIQPFLDMPPVVYAPSAVKEKRKIGEYNITIMSEVYSHPDLEKMVQILVDLIRSGKPPSF